MLLIFILFIIALVLVINEIFKRRDLEINTKLLWVAIILITPIIGLFLYVIYGQYQREIKQKRPSLNHIIMGNSGLSQYNSSGIHFFHAFKSLLILISLICFVTFINAQQSPLHADEILKEAFQKASKEKKNVFIMFHASWCGWCRKMDTAMNDKSIKKFFEDNYVIRHLVIYESKGKKNLENPGALDLLTKYKGNDLGIPYWLVVDKDGSLLADSQIRPEGAGIETKGTNSGCPATNEEVIYFIKVLKKTTSLKSEQLSVIEKRFRDVNRN